MRYSNDIFESVQILMRKHKIITKIIIAVLLLSVLSVCYKVGKRQESQQSQIEQQEQTIYSTLEFDENTKNKFPVLAFEEDDMDTEDSLAVKVNLSENKDTFTIAEGGAYQLSGELEGCIEINAAEQVVHLYFDNVNITSKIGPALFIKEAEKVIITLREGTNNIISDGGDYRGYEEYPACLFSDCDLTINGLGDLTVNGYYKDAILSKDVLKILDGRYIVKCKRNAFKGNDGIHIAGGEMFISTEKNGFMTEKKGSDGRGNLMISGGEINIIAGEYSFVTTKGSLYIYNCTINQKSIVGIYNIAKRKLIQEGCVNE